MPRQRKRVSGCAPEPEMEAPSGKRTKATKTETLDKPVVEEKTADSPKKDQASKHCGNEPSAYWLMKSEPESRLEKGIDVKFGIEDLKAQPKQTACWDGVRNYQARNFLRAMKLGEEAFFYHSNCKEPGIAGLMKIVKEAYPDHTQFEKDSPHYDPSSKKDNPKWSMVDVQFIRMTKRFIPLAELKVHHQAHKANGGPLQNMALFTRQRLSVQPLTQGEFDFVLSLEDKKPS
ncbi:thymocyte nuclear protein 1 [Vombatus ursinus]|uniref:Thymocyte nuclear protein 1 n=1 Tax=Vombatus ursinus TaxID=29139 RepID=A0A4X2M3W3_VOMUR|nr:thymocyte nuclear protein 1 [Vombatus ursinus]XP_027733435.1 thymocyte nuclear protein 1 [Vombatus ursinus]